MSILIGYVRVSSDSQKDNHSLPNQRAAIEGYCAQHNHKLLIIFEDIESAENAKDRRGLQQALQLIYADAADGLIVHKLDRFCRKVVDSANIQEDFLAKGKLLLSVSESVDLSSDDGIMMFQFKNVLQEYERKKIAERCKMGREKKREVNGWIGGAPPFGWYAFKKTLFPNEREQEIIAVIFDLHNKGWTNCAIAHYLNDQGLKTKRGKYWGNSQIHSILNEFPPVVKRLGLSPTDLAS